jgi:hypothetical protein
VPAAAPDEATFELAEDRAPVLPAAVESPVTASTSIMATDEETADESVDETADETADETTREVP